MAEDSALKLQSSTNPCCSLLKAKYAKLEDRRNALRQAVKLLEQQFDKVQSENQTLKNSLEVERRRPNSEKEGRERDSALRDALENEISTLKAEISSLQQKECLGAQGRDEEIVALRASLLEKQKEIEQMKQVIEKEKMTTNSEQKKVVAERKKADEAWRIVESERMRGDEERRKVEELVPQLEIMKKEVDEARSKLVLEMKKTEDMTKKFDVERQKAIKEKRRADSEKAKAEKQKKLADENIRKALEEKQHADILAEKLREERQKVEELQKEISKISSSRNLTEPPIASNGMVENVGQMEMIKRGDEGKLFFDDLNSKRVVNKHQAEKLKVLREKKHAGLAMVEAEELRKLAETNKLMAMEEKCRADKLSKQLEEYRQKAMGLEEELHRVISSRKFDMASGYKPAESMNADSVKLRRLKEQLKLKKVQLKHARQVAKIENSRNCILQQELSRLKIDFSYLAQRLSILDDSFFNRSEGIDKLAKVGNLSVTQNLNVPNLGMEPMLGFLEIRNGLVKPISVAANTSDSFRHGEKCSVSSFPVSRGSCTESFSGVNSTLEPVLGVSNEKQLQNSAINSCMVSSSDREFAGSLEGGAFSGNTHARLAEENLKLWPISKLSSEVMKMTHGKNLADMAENSVRDPSHIMFGKLVEDGKERRLLDAVEKIKFLHYEGKKLHLQMDEHLSALSGVLHGDTEKMLDKGKLIVSAAPDDSCPVQEMRPKKRKRQSAGKLTIQNCNNREIGECIKGGRDIVNAIQGDLFAKHERCQKMRKADKNRKLPSEVKVPQFLRGDDTKVCTQALQPAKENDATGSFLMGDQKIAVNFEDGADGNCLKLFELDDAIEEGKFRVAMEMPLSPTLPEICVESVDCVRSMMGKMPARSTSGNDGPSLSSEVESGSTLREDRCCIVLPNAKKSPNISRIYCAIRNCVAQSSFFNQVGDIVHNVLSSLAMELDLIPREKACVFFSVMLQKMTYLGNLEHILTSGFMLPLDTFATQISTALGDAVTRRAFGELCPVDELLHLIEEFLSEGRILAHSTVPLQSSVECDSKINIVMDGMNTVMVSRAASSDQLIAASVILSCICVAVDYVGFICEVSFYVLRIYGCNPSLMLTILHVFAHFCGKKYFSMKKYELVMTVIKSLVASTERGKILVSSPSSACKSWPKLPQCDECPFHDGADTIDSVASLLLEKVHRFALPRTIYCHPGSACLTNTGNLLSEKQIAQCSHHMAPDLVCEETCDASCCLNFYNRNANLSPSDAEFDGTLCQLSDVISLVELVACNMGWLWTCDKIVSPLLKILDSSTMENSCTAIVVLLGQLGRFGVDTSGHEDVGVVNLKCRLSSFLYPTTMQKFGLSFQIAIATALLGLLSIKFEDLIQSRVELPSVGADSVPTSLIRKWYFSLGSKQQSLVYGFLLSALM
ncbi:hypothetical protein RJ641_017647 [Dillenia turbinata]|uniref:Maternal effect embryo arrest 22 n=1 Tax=Dillenia turbinata TaxID=194707 RepID=A0AAN8URW1_9MAGN